jgi:hypothetical protein
MQPKNFSKIFLGRNKVFSPVRIQIPNFFFYFFSWIGTKFLFFNILNSPLVPVQKPQGPVKKPYFWT